MTKTTIRIDGMSCGMCETHINDAIRNNIKVKKVSSSYKKGETVIISESDISDNEIHSAIDNTGYNILSITSEPYEKKGLFGR